MSFCASYNLRILGYDTSYLKLFLAPTGAQEAGMGVERVWEGCGKAVGMNRISYNMKIPEMLPIQS